MPVTYAPEGGEFRVNTTTASEQYYPSITGLDGGGYVVTWMSYADGSGWDIYTQRYNSSGVAQGVETRVNTATAGNQLYPTVTPLAGGGYVVVWQSADAASSGIYAQRYNSEGVAQGVETLVNTTTASNQEWPSVATLAGGGYVVTWQSISQDGSGWGIYAQRYDSSGVAQGVETRVNTTITNSQDTPSVTALADGGYVIIWQSFAQDGSNYGIYAQRYDSAGVAQGGETLVNTTVESDQSGPSIAALEDGSYVVTWQSDQDGSATGIYMQRFDSSGVAQGGETLVNSTVADYQSSPSVAALAGGGYVVTWQSNEQDGDGTGIYAQHYDSAGSAQGGETLVNTTTASAQVYPAVAGTEGGGYVVTWMSYNQDGSLYGIYAQQFADGTFVNAEPSGGDNTVSVDGASYVFSRGDFNFSDSDGNAFVAVTITTLPASGVLRYENGSFSFDLTAGMTMPVGEIDGGYFRYVPPEGGSGTSPTFTFQVIDNGGQDNGGQDTDQTPNTMTLEIAVPNYAPQVDLDADDSNVVGTGFASAYTEGGAAAAIGDTDVQITDANAGDNVESVTITVTNPETGDVLTVVGALPSGLSLDPASTVTTIIITGSATAASYQTAIEQITFSNSGDNPTNGGTNTSRSITVLVNDGVADSNVATATVTVADDNADAPSGTSSTITASEDAFRLLDPADFGFSDADGIFAGVLISSISGGRIYYDADGAGAGEPVLQLLPKTYTAQDLIDGKVSIKANADANGSGIVTLAFSVIDDDGNMDASSNTLTVDVTAVNDAPVVTIAPLNYRPAGNETLVNTTTSNTQITASTAALADGSYVVIWTSYLQDGSGSGVYMQRYDSLGVALGAETRVNTTITGDQGSSSVTALAGGGYVVTWVSGQAGNNGIYAQRFDSSGTALGGETVVDTNTAYAQISTAIAALPSGGYVIAWTSYLQDGSSYGVYMQRYDASGVPLGVETRINTTTTDDQSDPSVTGLAGGGYVVTWMSYSQDGSVGGVYMQRYDASGVAQGIETRVNTTTTSHQSDPSVTGLADGSYVVTWTSYLQDGSSYGVYMQRYDASGVALGSETLVNSTTSGIQDSASVAALEAGGFVVTWSSYAQDGSGYGVYGQVYGSSGVAVGSEFLINTTTVGDQDNQSVTGLADGGYLVTWFGLDASSYGIYSQRFEPIYSAAEGSPLNLKGTMSVADVDAGAGTLTATLSVDFGILNVTAGTSGALVSGSGTSTVIITGSLAQINALLGSNATSTVQYVADSNTPPETAQLTLSVNDGGNTGSGGALVGSASETIVITAVNDEPAGADNSVVIAEGGSHVFAAADFGFSDVDGNSFAGVVIESLPTDGTLTLGGVTVTDGQFVSAAQIAAGNLVFTPTAGEHSSPYATFTFQVRDDGGTANGGQDTDQSQNTFTINVTAGSIDGTSGDDILNGTEEGDTINGLAGNDTISGLGGNDLIDGGSGNDDLDGGDGVDTASYQTAAAGVFVSLALSSAQNTVGAGTDTLSNFENLTGSAFNDRLTGNGAANVLTGLAGDDILRGNAGNDMLSGGAGIDTLDGGTGADAMTGGAGNDKYYVDELGDTIIEAAGEGTDTVYSSITLTLGANVETLVLTGAAALDGTGNTLANTLSGNSANNALYGLAGGDRIYGNEGNDIIDGGTGADLMYGGTGDDTFYVDHTRDNIQENAGEGVDTVIASAKHTLYSNVENLILTGTAALTGKGNALANTITGNSGNNNLYGLGGDDILSGGAGNDKLDGGTGADAMTGGVGNDTYYVDDLADTVIEAAGEGTDTVYSSITLTIGANIETLALVGTAAIDATGDDLANTLVGNSGANSLYGLAGGDRLYGNAGNDVIDGGTGADLMYGGTGDDTFHVDQGTDNIKENVGEGVDTAIASVSYALRANVENLVLTGASAINGTGTELANSITGNSGNNKLYGLAGVDMLSGGEGNDVLEGGAGRDFLTGGSGADQFLFRNGDFAGLTADTADTITDFDVAADTINLAAVDANSLLADDQAFAFIGTGAFSNTAGELRYEIIGGNTYVQGDTDGDGNADFLILVTGSHALTSGDFVI